MAVCAFPDPKQLGCLKKLSAASGRPCSATPRSFLPSCVERVTNIAVRCQDFIPTIDAMSPVYFCKKALPPRLKFECAVDKDGKPWTINQACWWQLQAASVSSWTRRGKMHDLASPSPARTQLDRPSAARLPVWRHLLPLLQQDLRQPQDRQPQDPQDLRPLGR